MSRWFLLLVLGGPACASLGGAHVSGDAVSWSIAKAKDPAAAGTLVCQGGQSAPCVLEKSTPQEPSQSIFTLHVAGPPGPTTFKGTILLGYLEDPDPRRYKSDVNLVSDGKEVHQSVYAHVASMPGQFNVAIHIEETSPGMSQPRIHDVVVPVLVQ